MFTANRIKTSVKPSKIESLNNGIYYYNYDITEYTEEVQQEDGTTSEETKYSFVQVRITGIPTYEKCVKAIIRAYISSDDEFNLINSYNSYQLDIDVSNVEYEDYLSLVQEIKEKVGTDFEVEQTTTSYSKPKQSDIISLLTMTINTMDLTDSQALSVKSLYPEWSTFIGYALNVGQKVKYNNKLFKVITQHTVQSQYPPSIDTASLYTEIVEDHAGTIDDPIPYPSDGNMQIYLGKYYIENSITYKCIRDSGQPLYAALSSLVNNYVEVVA